jgi:hypothetical protein
VQQLREAFPDAGPYRYAILDRDSIFNADVIAFLQATGLKPKRTSIQAPWRFPYARQLWFSPYTVIVGLGPFCPFPTIPKKRCENAIRSVLFPRQRRGNKPRKSQ